MDQELDRKVEIIGERHKNANNGYKILHSINLNVRITLNFCPVKFFKLLFLLIILVQITFLSL